MPAIQKTFTAKVDTDQAEDDAPGTFVALVSMFGNTDSYGDIVEAGAYTRTLKEWAAKGRPIPVVWSHQFSDPDNILGHYVSAEETAEGLKMKGVLDLDHPKAARIHKLMTQGLIVEFSISGEVREYELIEDDDEDSWWPGMSISDIELWEAGPCFKGANPETQLISVKSADLTGPLARRIRATATGEAIPTAKAKEAPAAKETPAAPEAAQDLLQRSTAATPAVRALLELATIN